MKIGKDYIYPLLSRPDLGVFRLNGHGLGNLLFVFFKALVIAEESDRKLLWPTWRQVKLKTLLEPSRTRRTYNNIFDRPDWAERELWLRFRAITGALLRGRSSSIQLVEGYGEYFHPFRGKRDHIRQRFYEMLPDQTRFAVEDVSVDCVMHIRLGDFRRSIAESDHRAPLNANSALPPSYYVDAIKMAKLNENFRRLIVISDSSRLELIESGYKIDEWGAVLIDKNDPVVDLLLLARAKSRILSYSTFSFWGAFLGYGISYIPYGVRLDRYGLSESEIHFKRVL